MPPTYTYSFDPNTSNKDAVRFLCQDTDMTTGTVRLADEEINWMLTKQTNVFLCAADAAEAIAGYWSRVQNIYIGPLRVVHSTPAVYFMQLAAALRRQAQRNTGGSTVQFFPVGDTNYCANGPRHIFKIGMDDYPGYSQFWPPSDLPPLYSYP